MRHVKAWTAVELLKAGELASIGKTYKQIGEALGRTRLSVQKKFFNERVKVHSPARPVDRIAAAAAMSPQEVDDKARVLELEAELSRLREQKTWETHSSVTDTAGGTLTIRRSDDHHGDDNHMLSCAESLAQKVLVVIEQYQPGQVQLIMLDDWIAGKGIFKEQDAQMSVAAVEQQIAVGAWKAREFIRRIRSTIEAPIQVFALKGNHEHANKVPVAHALFMECRALCEDIPDVKWTMRGDRTVINLAHTGTHNVLAMHGYGYSQVSPNSPKFVNEIKDTIIRMQQKMDRHEHIRRVLSGHTHWMSVGLERLVGLDFDTTGGLQRNNRVQLGMNDRPSGWIVYISPPGADGELLTPIGLKPDTETYDREIADPHLAMTNKRDCSDCLDAYFKHMREKGIIGPGEDFGLVTEGRW